MRRRHFIRTGLIFVPTVAFADRRRILQANVTPLASSVLIAVTGQALGTLRNPPNNFGGIVGFYFQALVNMTVTQLGIWVVSGNASIQTCYLYDNGGGNILGQVNINAAGQPTGFAYTALGSPVSLSSGTTYVLVYSVTSGVDQFYNSDTTLTTTADISITGNTYGYQLAQQTVGAGTSFGPPSFKYTKP